MNTQSAPKSHAVRWFTASVVVLGALGAGVWFGGRSQGLIGPSGSVTVPAVVAKTAHAAERLLAQRGLAIGTAYYVPYWKPKGTVLAATPAAGSQAVIGTKVVLQLSNGLELNPTVKVPDVLNDTITEAETALADSGLTYKTAPVQNAAPPKTVVSQSRAAGAVVPRHSRIVISVSTGPGTVVMPSLSGLQPARAGLDLQQAKLSVGTTSQQPSLTIPKGEVIGTAPAAGTAVLPGTTVAIVVSSGPPPTIVPYVMGMQVGTANTTIRAQGLVPHEITSNACAAPQANQVIAQAPKATTTVNPGTAVTITVCNPPPPPPSTTTTTTTVPATTTTTTAAG